MKNFGKNIIKLGIITTVICCFLLLALYVKVDTNTKHEIVQNPPICESSGGFLGGINRFSECYDCTSEVVFSEEKLLQTFPELFSAEEIDQYVKNFFQLNPHAELKYGEGKRYCFEFLNGQFYQLLDDTTGQEVPIYEDKQVAPERDDYNEDEDFIVHYKNGKLKAKRETSKDGKEIYYESYYNNGQIRSKEWRIVVEKTYLDCAIVKDEKGKEISNCKYLSEGLIGLEEYYKNGQLRIKIEKGKKEIHRDKVFTLKNYLSIPYEMYNQNGKLKEKYFEDGTIEKYSDNGKLIEKCYSLSPVQQHCEEYDTNGKITTLSEMSVML